MSSIRNMQHQRWQSNAGIAIGPILFIIAILAILAAAIAAGSGSFTAPTATEGAKTKASGIISLGDNLKMGMDRLTMENSISWGGWNINNNDTINNNDLFSPNGGGISPPSTSLAGNPSTDLWYYPTGPVPGLGTTSPEQLAVLNVAPEVCNEINNRANGFASTPTGSDLGDFGSTSPVSLAGWPGTLNGKTVGCVQNTNGTTPGNFFFEVLYVQ